MWWTESLGRIELNITKSQAASCAHMGSCDADIAILRTVPAIRRQLNKLDPDLVRDALKEYGAWNLTEMSDHDANLSRLLWIACCNIEEGR